MAGYSDLPFRRLVRNHGGLGLAFTEMINPQSILHQKGRRVREILATDAEDRPLGYQIYGTDPKALQEAARILQERGAALIDINMGCPQRKIAARGAGAGLLRDPAAAVRLAAAVIASVAIPVTVKLRLGWDHKTPIAAGLARDLETAGAAALTIHGRTRGQGYMGSSDLEAIRQVVESVRAIPVIGNGDIISPAAAVTMLDRTGCAGIMLGRGVLRNPRLIRQIWRHLQGWPDEPIPESAAQWAEMEQHLDSVCGLYGERAGHLLFRKWVPFYASRLKIKRPAMVQLLTITGLDEFKDALRKSGGFAPGTLPSFDDTPGLDARGANNPA